MENKSILWHQITGAQLNLILLMKNLIFTLLGILSLATYGQSNFQQGYIVDLNGQKQAVYIKNSQWLNSPNEIRYKSTIGAEETLFGDVSNIKEFGIGDYVRYEARTIPIDMSNSNISSLSTEMEPAFETQTVFISKLIEGQADLYMYRFSKGDRFYLEVNGEMLPLVYKKYRKNQNSVMTNMDYKKILYDRLKCEDISANEFRKVKYNQQSLLEIVRKYNQCVNGDYKEFAKATVPAKFYLTLLGGIQRSSLEVKYQESSIGSDLYSAEFPDEVDVRISVLLEYSLPFNNNKWRLFLETAYMQYSSETQTSGEGTSLGNRQDVAVDYKAIDLVLGLKHVIYLSENSTIGIRGGFNSVVDLSDEITYSSLENRTIDTRANFLFGIGYEYQRFSAEFIAYTERNILGDYQFYSAPLNSYGISIGYKIL